MSEFKTEINKILEENHLLPSSITLSEYLKSDFEFEDFLALKKARKPTMSPQPNPNLKTIR